MRAAKQTHGSYNRTPDDDSSSLLSLPQWGSGWINPRMENLMHFSYAMADTVKLPQCVLWIYIFEPITKVK